MYRSYSYRRGCNLSIKYAELMHHHFLPACYYVVVKGSCDVRCFLSSLFLPRVPILLLRYLWVPCYGVAC